MRCPECYLENYARAKQCVRCGADLTQAALMETEYHGANQVWNTDIDPDRNRKNSRTALAVLGVTVLLVIALVAAVVLYLPKVVSYSMDSFDFSLPEFSLSEFLDSLGKPEIVSVQSEPAPEPAMRLDGADMDFINVLTAYAIELALVEDEEMQTEIHQMFFPELEYLAGQEYSYNALEILAQETHRIALLLNDPALGSVERLQLLNELSTTILTANEGFYFLSDMTDVLDYYVDLQWYTQAMLEVEYDLREQLVGTGTVWSKEHGCEIVSYTNNTSYTLDISFFNDFVTDTEHYSSEIGWPMLFPGETAEIPLCDLIEIGDRDHTWTLTWVIHELYVDDIPLEDYYED